jgi:preprotein translocase subunit SecG
LFTILLVFHILICLMLVVVVLLQAGKGGGLASAFGGSGTTEAVFGGRQAATFLGKATTILGTIFMVSSFGLALLSSYASGPRSAVQEQLMQNAPAPVAPAPQPLGGDVLQQEQKSQQAQPAAQGQEKQAQPAPGGTSKP